MSEPSDLQNHGAAESSWAMRLPLIVGFLSWSAPAVLYGMSIIAHEQAYQASHPLGPNEVYCGSGGMLAFAMFFCVAPICGVIGAFIGWMIRSFYSA